MKNLIGHSFQKITTIHFIHTALHCTLLHCWSILYSHLWTKGDCRAAERTTIMEYLCNKWSEGWCKGYRWNCQWNAHFMEPFFAYEKNRQNECTSYCHFHLSYWLQTRTTSFKSNKQQFIRLLSFCPVSSPHFLNVLIFDFSPLCAAL